MSVAGASLDALLRPRSIAVVGASDDPTRIGGRPIRHLKDGGYYGAIYPINPSRVSVQGIKAWPNLGAVPGPIDCAVLVLAAGAVLDAVRQCAALRVGAVVIYSAGFAELGADGQRLQHEIAAVARAAGMRIVGPNCLGVYNIASRAYLCSTDLFQQPVPGRHIGLVSQSGGFGSHVLKLAQGQGLIIGKWITTGNECDVEFGEALAVLAADPEVDILVGYIEGIRNRDTFLDALRIARAQQKPVVLMKVGRTEKGAHAAASHTASLAGTDAVYDAVMREYGVWRASCTDELLDVIYALRLAPHLPAAATLGVMTPSGGIGAQIADFASDAGLDLPPLPESAAAALHARIANAAIGNPVDITGQYMNDIGLVAESVDILQSSGAYEMVLAFLGINASVPSMEKPLIESMTRLRAKHPGALVALAMVAPETVVRQYEAAGFLVFSEPRRAVIALAALTHFARVFAAPPPVVMARGAVHLPLSMVFNEVEAKEIAAACTIALPPERCVTDVRGALAAAQDIGYPVALKVVSRDLLHKTDVGGVALGLADAQALEAALTAMQSTLAACTPTARIEGYLVSAMVGGGVECIVGVHRDPLFGPVIMFGLGGVMVEVMKDAALALAPVDEAGARRLIAGIKGYALLDGYRGQPRADVDALARAIARVSQLAADHADRLVTFEINPLRVMPGQGGVIALDAVLVTDAGPQDSANGQA